jgi:uncharacterized membrane protein YkvA (DUF1232 family)
MRWERGFRGEGQITDNHSLKTKRWVMANQKPQHNPDLLSRFISDLILVIRLMFDRRVSTTAKLIPLLMLVYIISPLDLIPDVFVPLGIVDDITVLVIGLQLFIHSAPPGVVAEYRGGGKKRDVRKPKEIEHDHNVTIIDGEYTVREDEQRDTHQVRR